MDNTWKFLNFLNSLESEDPVLLEAVNEGFMALLENDEQIAQHFVLDTFKSLKSFAARKRYAGQFLKKLGQGSSRAAYEIDPTTILKMAINKKGLDQNGVEMDVSNLYDIVPEVKEADWNDHLWIIAERAEKLSSPSEFETLSGISWNDFVTGIKWEIVVRLGNRNSPNTPKPPIMEMLWENEFFHSVTDMAVNYGMPAGDLMRFGSFGKIGSKLVLIDSGLTQEVWNEHYGRK